MLSEIIGVIVLTSVWQTLICSECPANCVTCTNDSVDSGTTCTACVRGKYSGALYDLGDQPYYDDCRYDCIYGCVSCASYHNCTECPDGRYGTACRYSCYSGCEGGQCDKLDGKCSCKTGYTSRFCYGQLSCSNNPCACCKNNKCETNNSNYCSDGCIDDVRGATCDNVCPANCETCTQDSVAGGLPCTSCVPGQYSGRVYDNRDYPYYDDCRQYCKDDCVACTSYVNCTECVDGRYGTFCQYSCFSGCEGGVCDKLDGKCTCRTGDTSGNCKLCTNTRCKNNICDTNNYNYCTEGCIDGNWGDTCDNLCPPGCETCTQDSVAGGRPCTSCVPGKYSHKLIYIWSSMSHHNDCQSNCTDICVSCTSFINCNKCVNGRHGTDCTDYCGKNCLSCTSITNCTECIDGRYGSNCSSACSTGCDGGICNKTDGSCSCVDGRYGTHCNSTCSTGCEGGICNKTDGSCSCVNGRYGTHCNSTCSTGCEGGICNKTDGSCACVNGRYGTHCNSTCSTGCEGGICNKTDGSCSCVNGRYGTHCNSTCSTDCEGGICNKTDGSCSCVDGRYGTNCDYYCTCIFGVCSKTDGSCPADKTNIYTAVGIVIALGLIIVLIVICRKYGLYVKLTLWLSQKCGIRWLVTPLEVNSIENDGTEQDTRRESVEMTVLNENRETADIHVGGSIYYNPKKNLGSGSYGTVFEGRSGLNKNKPVAVKKVECLSNQDANELLNINKEIKALETLENKHIIRFIDSYIYNNTVYLAFELAIGTLVDYVSPSNDSWRLSLTDDDVVRGIIAGLNYTNAKNILHRDLKPGNIFIVDHSDSGLKAVIGDFGQAKVMTENTVTMTGNTGSNGYIAPEVYKAMLDSATVSLGTKCTKASDIFALGLVMYYVKSLGNSPFGINNLAAQDSISKGNPPNFQHIANRLDTIPYVDMLKQMLNNNQDDRPSITVVSEHPALWTSDKIIKYFVLKSDEFEAMIRAGPSNKNLLEDPNLITNGNWMNQLPVNMGTYLRRYTLPNRTSPMYSGKETEVRFLLRAIRNTNGHYQGYPQNTLAEMGAFPEGHVTLWLKVCPGLLMHVYNKLGPL